MIKFKTISLLLSISLLIESLAGAAPVSLAGASWSDVLHAGQQARTDIASHESRIRIPKAMAQVRDSKIHDTQELILNIQDAHASLDAQKAISGILDHLVTNFDLKLVGLEGAQGRVDTSIVSSYPQAEVRSAAANYEMKQGRISAAEFYSMVSGASVGLYGVDDPDLYKKNLTAFRQVVTKRDAGREAVKTLRRLLKEKEDAHYSSALKKFLKHYRLYSDSGEKFSEHWKHISSLASERKLPLSNYLNLSKLSNLISTEKSIDFKKASIERESLVAALTPKLSKKDLAELINRMERLKKGEFAPGAFYLSLCQSADRCGIGPESHQSFIAYTRYALQYESLDMWAIFDEMAKFGDSLRDKLAVTSQEKELLRVSDNIDRISDLVELKLLKKHASKESFSVTGDLSLVHRVLGVKPADILTLEEILKDSDTFYHIAQERDQALTNNLLRKMRRDGVQVGALVTGGFHSEGIAELLDRQKISYMVVMPKYENKEGDRPYVAILTNRPEVFEKAVSAKGYSLSAASLLDATFEPGNLVALERMVAEMLATRASMGDISIKQWRQETALFLRTYYRAQRSVGAMSATRALISPKRLASTLRLWIKSPLPNEKGAYNVQFSDEANNGARTYTVYAQSGKVNFVRVSEANPTVAAARLAEESSELTLLSVLWKTVRTFFISMSVTVATTVATIFMVSGEQNQLKGRASPAQPVIATKEPGKSETTMPEPPIVEKPDPIEMLEEEIRSNKEAIKVAEAEYEGAEKEGSAGRKRSALFLERVLGYRVKIAELKIRVLKNQAVIDNFLKTASDEEAQIVESASTYGDIYEPRLKGAPEDLRRAVLELIQARISLAEYERVETHHRDVVSGLVMRVNEGSLSAAEAKASSGRQLRAKELEWWIQRASELERRMNSEPDGDIKKRIRIELLATQKKNHVLEVEIKVEALNQELEEKISTLPESHKKAVAQAMSKISVVDSDEAKSLEYLFEADAAVPVEAQQIVWRLLSAQLELEEALATAELYQNVQKEADRGLWGEQSWEAARAKVRLLVGQGEGREQERRKVVDRARNEVKLRGQAALVEKEIQKAEHDLQAHEMALEEALKKSTGEVEERRPGTPIPIPAKLKAQMIQEVNAALKDWTKSGRKITDHPAYKLTIPRPYDDFYRYQLMFSTEQVDENLRLRVLSLFDQGVRTMTESLIPRQMLLREYDDAFLQSLKGYKLVGPHTFFTDESKRWGYGRFQSLFDETNQDRARLDILMYIFYVTDEDQSETYLKPLVAALPVSAESRREFNRIVEERTSEPNPFKKPYWDRVAEKMRHEASGHPIHTPPQPVQTDADVQTESSVQPTELLMRSSLWATELNPQAPTQNNMAPIMRKYTFNPVEMPYFSPSGLVQGVTDHDRRFSDSDLDVFDESLLAAVYAGYVTELQKLSPTKGKVIPVEDGKKWSIDELIAETQRRLSLMREENKLGRHRAQLWLSVLEALKKPENHIHQAIRREIEKGADLKQAIGRVYQRLAYNSQRVAELMRRRNDLLQAFYDGINSPGKEVIENSEFYKRRFGDAREELEEELPFNSRKPSVKPADGAPSERESGRQSFDNSYYYVQHGEPEPDPNQMRSKGGGGDLSKGQGKSPRPSRKDYERVPPAPPHPYYKETYRGSTGLKANYPSKFQSSTIEWDAPSRSPHTEYLMAILGGRSNWDPADVQWRLKVSAKDAPKMYEFLERVAREAGEIVALEEQIRLEQAKTVDLAGMLHGLEIVANYDLGESLVAIRPEEKLDLNQTAPTEYKNILAKAQAMREKYEKNYQLALRIAMIRTAQGFHAQGETKHWTTMYLAAHARYYAFVVDENGAPLRVIKSYKDLGPEAVLDLENPKTGHVHPLADGKAIVRTGAASKYDPQTGKQVVQWDRLNYPTHAFTSSIPDNWHKSMFPGSLQNNFASTVYKSRVPKEIYEMAKKKFVLGPDRVPTLQAVADAQQVPNSIVGVGVDPDGQYFVLQYLDPRNAFKDWPVMAVHTFTMADPKAPMDPNKQYVYINGHWQVVDMAHRVEMGMHELVIALYVDKMFPHHMQEGYGHDDRLPRFPEVLSIALSEKMSRKGGVLRSVKTSFKYPSINLLNPLEPDFSDEAKQDFDVRIQAVLNQIVVELQNLDPKDPDLVAKQKALQDKFYYISANQSFVDEKTGIQYVRIYGSEEARIEKLKAEITYLKIYLEFLHSIHRPAEEGAHAADVSKNNVEPTLDGFVFTKQAPVTESQTRPIAVPDATVARAVREIDKALADWEKQGKDLQTHPAHTLAWPQVSRKRWGMIERMFSSYELDEITKLGILDLEEHAILQKLKLVGPEKLLLVQRLLLHFDDALLMEHDFRVPINDDLLFSDLPSESTEERAETYKKTRQRLIRLNIIFKFLAFIDANEVVTYQEDLPKEFPMGAQSREEIAQVKAERKALPNPHELSPQQRAENKERWMEAQRPLISQTVGMKNIPVVTPVDPAQALDAYRRQPPAPTPTSLVTVSASQALQSRMDHSERGSDPKTTIQIPNSVSVDPAVIAQLKELSPTARPLIPTKARTPEELLSELSEHRQASNPPDPAYARALDIQINALSALNELDSFSHQQIARRLKEGTLPQMVESGYHRMARLETYTRVLESQRQEAQSRLNQKVRGMDSQVVRGSNKARQALEEWSYHSGLDPSVYIQHPEIIRGWLKARARAIDELYRKTTDSKRLAIHSPETAVYNFLVGEQVNLEKVLMPRLTALEKSKQLKPGEFFRSMAHSQDFNARFPNPDPHHWNSTVGENVNLLQPLVDFKFLYGLDVSGIGSHFEVQYLNERDLVSRVLNKDAGLFLGSPSAMIKYFTSNYGIPSKVYSRERKIWLDTQGSQPRSDQTEFMHTVLENRNFTAVSQIREALLQARGENAQLYESARRMDALAAETARIEALIGQIQFQIVDIAKLIHAAELTQRYELQLPTALPKDRATESPAVVEAQRALDVAKKNHAAALRNAAIQKALSLHLRSDFWQDPRYTAAGRFYAVWVNEDGSVKRFIKTPDELPIEAVLSVESQVKGFMHPLKNGGLIVKAADGVITDTNTNTIVALFDSYMYPASAHAFSMPQNLGSVSLKSTNEPRVVAKSYIPKSLYDIYKKKFEFGEDGIPTDAAIEAGVKSVPNAIVGIGQDAAGYYVYQYEDYKNSKQDWPATVHPIKNTDPNTPRDPQANYVYINGSWYQVESDLVVIYGAHHQAMVLYPSSTFPVGTQNRLNYDSRLPLQVDTKYLSIMEEMSEEGGVLISRLTSKNPEINTLNLMKPYLGDDFKKLFDEKIRTALGEIAHQMDHLDPKDPDAPTKLESLKEQFYEINRTQSFTDSKTGRRYVRIYGAKESLEKVKKAEERLQKFHDEFLKVTGKYRISDATARISGAPIRIQIHAESQEAYDLARSVMTLYLRAADESRTDKSLPLAALVSFERGTDLSAVVDASRPLTLVVDGPKAFQKDLFIPLLEEFRNTQVSAGPVQGRAFKTALNLTVTGSSEEAVKNQTTAELVMQARLIEKSFPELTPVSIFYLGDEHSGETGFIYPGGVAVTQKMTENSLNEVLGAQGARLATANTTRLWTGLLQQVASLETVEDQVQVLMALSQSYLKQWQTQSTLPSLKAAGLNQDLTVVVTHTMLERSPRQVARELYVLGAAAKKAGRASSIKTVLYVADKTLYEKYSVQSGKNMRDYYQETLSGYKLKAASLFDEVILTNKRMTLAELQTTYPQQVSHRSVIVSHEGDGVSAGTVPEGLTALSLAVKKESTSIRNSFTVAVRALSLGTDILLPNLRRLPDGTFLYLPIPSPRELFAALEQISKQVKAIGQSA